MIRELLFKMAPVESDKPTFQTFMDRVDRCANNSNSYNRDMYNRDVYTHHILEELSKLTVRDFKLLISNTIEVFENKVQDTRFPDHIATLRSRLQSLEELNLDPNARVPYRFL